MRFAREALSAARAQLVYSLITLLLVAASAFGVVVTAGRSAGSEAQVLGTMDAAGTRLISVIQQQPSGRITTSLVDTLHQLPAVTQVGGFGETFDVSAAGLPGHRLVAVHEFYGWVGDRKLTPGTVGPAGASGLDELVASPSAMAALGLWSQSGTVTSDDRRDGLIDSVVTAPDYLASAEPLVLLPISGSVQGDPRQLHQVYVMCAGTNDVNFVVNHIQRLLTGVPAGSVAIQTSAQFAAVQSAVSGQLSRQGHAIVIGVLLVSTAAILVNVLGMVSSRRRDFGRRRALGATRRVLIGLTIGQVALAAIPGALFGVAAGAIVVRASHSPLPPWSYLVALVTALTCVTVIAAAIPSVLAAFRDPVRELRVP